ncbi:ABC transporter permease [Alkalihalobacillus sp. FSL R5-0424]
MSIERNDSLKILLNKFTWIRLGLMIVVVCILMIGIMGSVTEPTPKNLSVAFVNEDQGIQLEDDYINIGKIVGDKILKNSSQVLEWSTFDTKDDALDQLNQGESYAIFLLPTNFSERAINLVQEPSQRPNIEIIVNEGVQYTAANTTEQSLNQLSDSVNQIIQNLTLEQVQNVALTSEQLMSIMEPVEITREVINAVGPNTANGSAPVFITQVLWLSVFIGSAIFFVSNKKSFSSCDNKYCPLISQLISGSLLILIAVTTILVFAEQVLGVSISNFKFTILYLMVVGFVFYVLQNALLNWMGLFASPIILLLFLFSIPILSYPIEFLPTVTNQLLYSWIPLRFSVEGLRELFFFDEVSIWKAIDPLLFIYGFLGLSFMGLSLLKINNNSKSDRKAKEQPM